MRTRRQFIGAASTLLATAAVPRSLAANPPPETLSLGYGLYAMKTVPLPEAIARCAGIGYRNIEFTLYPGYPTEPPVFSADQRKTTVRQLRGLNLSASCFKLRPETQMTPAVRRRGEQQVEAAAKLALDLAVPVPPLIAVHTGGKTSDWEALKQANLDQLGAWTAICTALGVPLAIKAHVGNSVDRPDRLLWLLERIPSLKIVYDHSHFSLLDLGLEESLRALRPRLAMIQAKDARHVGAGKHEFLLPGDGGTDYARYFRELDRLRFSGPVVVEVSAQLFNQPGYDPFAAATRSYRVLADALAARRVR